MEIKIVLSLISFACFWLADGCDRNNVNSCKDDATCRIHSSNTHGKRHTRSVQKNGANYSIMLRADPCSFNTYDIDEDGAITKEEFNALLGINEETDALFIDLNLMTDDGNSVIKPDEFYTMVPLIITDCFKSDK
ncbi:uncharacterized protein LOC123543912 [Mercenaria mercenaria]|uniref:uncharacterized protein LOC123543912 n=1 Tax=Mercenaria mercenaria TaxID=6596 RepID=UPI001E1DE9BD|nr:uncharacterized protein LOC123543912 [Mercenaria mercenaria]